MNNSRELKIIHRENYFLFLVAVSNQQKRSEQERENVTPTRQFESAPHRLMCSPTPPSHLPPLKQLCCFGPALKAVLITGTERRSERRAGSILLKPNERTLCRVWGLQRPEEAMSLPIVLCSFPRCSVRLVVVSNAIFKPRVTDFSLLSITDSCHRHSFSSFPHFLNFLPTTCVCSRYGDSSDIYTFILTFTNIYQLTVSSSCYMSNIPSG